MPGNVGMNQDMSGTKIFGIGLMKTGTSTLGVCGTILGYRCVSYKRRLIEDLKLRNDFTAIKEVVSQYDLFEDWPWPLIYRELDQMYPGSKFILTTRKNENVWLESLKKHSMITSPTRHCRKLAFGYNFPHGNEEQHLEFYRRHNDEVRQYFKGREDDFAELCWENGSGWKEFCGFLGRDIPDVPFPHENKGQGKKVNIKRYVLNRLLCRL